MRAAYVLGPEMGSLSPELLALHGARQTLMTHRPFVRFGFHPFAFSDPALATSEIRAFFTGVGYKVGSSLSDSLTVLGLEEYDAVPVTAPL